MSSLQLGPRYCSFWKIATTREVPELGPGPRRGVLPKRELEARLEVWAGEQDLDADALARVRATALLYHDHHDAAHDIVQDLNDVESALIHGVLHRREPDYWNAKYWLRRAEAHPIYVALGRRMPELTTNMEQQSLANRLTLPGAFEPLAFVDLCEETERRPALDPWVLWLRQVQHAEFEEIIRFLVTD